MAELKKIVYTAIDQVPDLDGKVSRRDRYEKITARMEQAGAVSLIVPEFKLPGAKP